MEHLEERLSALVDGELGHADRDKALNHLAACESCRFEAEKLRRLKRRLHGLDAPEPSPEFMGRLSAMHAPSSDPPMGPPANGGDTFGSRPPIGTSRPLGGGFPSGHNGEQAARAVAERKPKAPASVGRPTSARAEWGRGRGSLPLSVLRPRWNRTRYAAVGVSLVAVALGTAFAAGGEVQGGPMVRPAIEDYAAEHAVTAQQTTVPAGDAGSDSSTQEAARAGSSQSR